MDTGWTPRRVRLFTAMGLSGTVVILLIALKAATGPFDTWFYALEVVALGLVWTMTYLAFRWARTK